MTKGTILICDANGNAAEFLKPRLIALGYSVLVTGSALGMARVANLIKVDVILTGATLEKKGDGYAAAEEIRMLFNVPIIYLTGDTATAISAATDYGTLQGSPFTPLAGNKLVRFLRILLRHSAAHASSDKASPTDAYGGASPRRARPPRRSRSRRAVKRLGHAFYSSLRIWPLRLSTITGVSK
jgi:DNA-binding response OmpR family regulator